MEENKSILFKSAMNYGFIMGIYWVIKFLFIIFSSSAPALSFIYTGLTLAVPLVAYMLTKRYRNDIGGSISFFHAWRFGTIMYFFAALLVAVEHYFFFQFISPDAITQSMNQLTTLLKDSQMSTELLEAMGQVDLSPIRMAVQGIFNNVFYGILLSLPIALLLCTSNNKAHTIGEANDKENNTK